jgi:methyl-accepting chemotaxis protein
VKDWKISRKLWTAFSAIVLSLCAVATVVFFNLATIETKSNDTSHSNEILNKIDDLAKSMLDLSGQVRGYLLTRDEAFANGVDADHASVQQGVEALRRQIKTPDQKARLEEIARAADAYVAEAGDPEIRLGRDPATLSQALAVMNSGVNKRDMNAFKSAVRRFEDAERRLLAERSSAQASAIATARLTLLCGIAIAAGLSCLMGLLLKQMIADPVRAMTETMRRLAAGDHAVEVPAIGRKDEVGEMAGAVLAFKEAALDKLRLEGQASADRDASDQERRRNEESRGVSAREQAKVVEGLAKGLAKLSAGDLTCALREPFAGEYEALRADFNSAVESLREAMAAIGRATGDVGGGAEEISSASDDLSRRTEQQAATLEETAAALEQITVTVRQSADGAQQASVVVSSTKADALRSGEVVREAVSAMSEIERSSTAITQIIGVIDEIAFQTNLLALNAGVEAARAGEAGRGFAVVAQEVRGLAQRSAEAAKEIKGLIAASSTEVGRGVRLVGETGSALSGIVAKVAEIDTLVAEIASSAQEQAASLAEVNTAVNQMDQVTQQNAAMVEETTAAAAQLKSKAHELARLVGRFDVEGRGAAPGKNWTRAAA